MMVLSRSDAVSPQAADVVDTALSSTLSGKSQSLSENINLSHGENSSFSPETSVEAGHNDSTNNGEDLRLNNSGASQDDYLEHDRNPSEKNYEHDRNPSEKNYFEKYPNSDNVNSPDIESDQDRDELIPADSPRGSFIDNRAPDSPRSRDSFIENRSSRNFSQRLPSNLPTSAATNIPSNLFGSAFSAEEARLRLSLESSNQFKERFGPQFHSPPQQFGGDSDPHRRFSLQDRPRPEFETNGSTHPPSPGSNSLTSSPIGSYRGHGGHRFDDKDSALIPRIKEGLYFCHLCSFSGTTQQEFDLHMTCHFEHVCPHCDYKSRTEGRLKRHIKDFHTDDADGGFGSRAMPGRPKIFRCKQCEYSTTDKVEFWTHSRTHIKEDKLLQCPRCPFVTEYKHHLEYHLRNHFGSKPFKCPKCNYACVNKSMLNSHMKSHTNVYQYRCADCTYATKYCHSLKLHLRKYNHKPAAVLNSDGSLPQGVDATSSGLSLLAKRGPPRGPRGPRKDKLEPRMGGSNFLQMPPSPMAGLVPGMMSPFWPMLHGGLPNGMPSPLGLGPRFNPGLPALPPPPPNMGVKSEEMKSPTNMRSSPFKCNFCSFIGTNREVLTSHVMKIHASENQDLFSMFGISSESLLGDSRKRMCGPDMLKSPMKAPRMGIFDSPHGVKLEMPDDYPNSSQHERIKSGNEPMMPYPFMSERFQPPSGGGTKDEGIDILKQMTLKFGSGPAPTEPPPKPAVPAGSTGDCPLDLTKPRTSPPLIPHVETFPDYKRDAKPDDGEQSSGENSVYSNEMTSPTPRKRSRKGKAFKLDTLCMKLQERHAGIYGSDEESMDEMYSSDLLPVDTDVSSPIGEYDKVNAEKEKADDHGKSATEADMKKNDNDAQIMSGKDAADGGESSSVDDAVAGATERFQDQDEDTVSEDLQEIHTNLQILNEMKSKDTKNNNDSIEQFDCKSNKSNNSQDVERVDTADGELEPGERQSTPVAADDNKSHDSQLVHVSHNRRKAVPAAIQRGADIAWRILNDPLTDAAQLMKNGNKGVDNNHGSSKMELSTLDKKLWFEAPDCNDPQKGDYECPHCQISFGDCIMYTMHMGYHGYKDPYKCNMCGDTCKDRVEFFLHIARAAHN